MTNLDPLGSAEQASRSRSLIASEPLTSCYVGKLFFTTGDRFSWGRWQSDHSLLTSFHLDIAAAKRQAEHLRTQGTAWYIKELPALVLNGPEHCVILTEINEPTPLKEFRRIKPVELTLLAISDLIFDSSSESIVRLVGPAGAIRSARGPYGTYSSAVDGAKKTLSWARLPDRNRRPHAVNVLARVLSELPDQCVPPA